MLKDNQKYKGHRGNFMTFTCIAGLIVGVFSVISDNLPNLSDGVTVFKFVISYLAVMINSLPIWFILAMVVGYIFAKKIRDAVLLGAIYTIAAITFYFVISNIYQDTPVTISFKEEAISYLIWYGASTVGGIIGGCVGFFIKKTPYALLSLLAGLILQLFVNGTSSWNNIVGIAQNITYCLMIGCIVIIYIVIVKFNISLVKRNEERL
ncbi:DUF6518 family protein [Terrilactibacillus laevilacticus]|uniref:DUF6518 family protein n=1 Tax=Terrilactibacillus laevilacticus TaxID=1380157 RepID=UPI001FE3C97B|nr:DUF6518 family protein [Terrilactibacillus laevilacticus]